jgi:hypothetical protein
MLELAVAVLLLGSPGWARGEPAAAPWSLARVVDGIHVWSAETPRDFWGYARGRVQATPEAIFHRVGDFEGLPNVFPWLATVRVLERGERTALVYFRYDLPWPISDRSYTARHEWWTEPDGAIVLDVEGVDGLGPAAGDTVAIERVLTRIVMRPADATSTEVDYLFRADLAGMLPRAVRAQTAWKIPLNVMLSMRRSLAPNLAKR